MAAGAATLSALLADDGRVWTDLEALGARLEGGIRAVFAAHDLGWTVVRRGSILWLALQDGPTPVTAEAIDSGAAERYATLHAALLDRGVYLAPSAYEVIFVSAAHDEAVIDETIEAIDEAVSERSEETILNSQFLILNCGVFLRGDSDIPNIHALFSRRRRPRAMPIKN